jgi:hypothetical protein
LWQKEIADLPLQDEEEEKEPEEYKAGDAFAFVGCS